MIAIQYSPDLHYVIYRTVPGSKGQSRFILLDINTNQSIWTGPEVGADMVGNRAGMPVWLPNSSGLVYSWTDEKNGENFYHISLNGKVTQFTWFENVEIEGVNAINLPLPSWSPDGRYMIFEVKQANQDVSKRWFRLYVWDNKEKVVFRPCLPDENNILDIYNVIWSFDSTHFAMQLPYRAANATSSSDFSLATRSATVILDLFNKTIFELPDPNNRGEYTLRYGDVNFGILGWVNWEFP